MFSTPPAALPQRLQHGQFIRLNGKRPVRVRSHRGTLWITVDGNAEDIVVDAGSAVLLDRGGRVLVTPLGGEAVASTEPTGTAPGWLDHAARLWSRLTHSAQAA